MIEFFKKILGLPTKEEEMKAKNQALAPYKIEPPTFNNKSGDIVDAPVKKTRTPRTKKNVENKKATEVKVTPAAKKVGRPRSKKV